jgi:hypothetical protein
MAVSVWKGRDPKTDLSPEHFEVTFEGAVLSTFERNFHDDSDFVAAVWDAEAGRIREIEYASTRGWTYLNGATVDATAEVVEAASEWLKDKVSVLALERANLAEREVKVGKTVQVVKGRKVAKGTEGVVFWVGPDRYKSSRWGTSYRVGFTTADGEKVFTAMTNVEVVGAKVFTDASAFRPATVSLHRPLDSLAYSALSVASKSTLVADGYRSNR